MNLYDSVLLVAAVAMWVLTVNIEYMCTPSVYEEGQLITPCSLQKRNSGYNYVFVALPVAILFYVQMKFANEVTGCLGLTVIMETGIILAINGFLQIHSIHVTLTVLLGLCYFLMWLNVCWVTGLIVFLPMLAMCGVEQWYEWLHPEIHCKANTFSSVCFWIMDMYFILSRLFFLTASPHDLWDHQLFDCVSSGAMLLLLAGILVLRYVFPVLPIWN